MIEEQNPWWLGREHIYEHEVFRRYADSKVKWVPDVLSKLSLEPYSLNFIVGARQVGKSTALLLLANTLLDRVRPEAVFYFSCDKLADYRELDQVLVEYLRFKERSGVGSAYILLDEVTFPREWYRAVKYRVDRGDFSRDVLVLSGSLSMRAKREIETFPGRRGGGRTLLMNPLSFSEFVEIHGVRTPRGDIGYALTESQRLLPLSGRLSELFEVYLESGGFPNPVRDIMLEGRVRSSTYSDFISSVSADLAKLRRSETFFKLAVRGILEKASSQVSYHTIAKEFGVGTVKTAISYIDLLRDLYLLNMLEAVDPSSGLPLSKKEKKLYFTDPFIFHHQRPRP
jgi:Predicted ATPase (AAA+ superfamily)